jgi:hypothetical protein
VLNSAETSAAQIALWLIGTCIVVVQAIRWRARLRKLESRERAAREMQHTLIENTQALILQVHGAIRDLEEDDKTRRRIASVLDAADEQLSAVCDRVQDLQKRRNTLDG